MAEEGSYSPDSARLAYVPFWNRRAVPNAYIAWKRYRGGLAPVIWIARLSDSTIERVPHTDSNDFNPTWVGDKIYFLSDRNGPVPLFARRISRWNWIPRRCVRVTTRNSRRPWK